MQWGGGASYKKASQSNATSNSYTQESYGILDDNGIVIFHICVHVVVPCVYLLCYRLASCIVVMCTSWSCVLTTGQLVAVEKFPSWEVHTTVEYLTNRCVGMILNTVSIVLYCRSCWISLSASAAPIYHQICLFHFCTCWMDCVLVQRLLVMCLMPWRHGDSQGLWITFLGIISLAQSNNIL